ncbi:MAG: DUF342 domain-containing protein [Phycisphaerales bacterium]
MTQDTCDLDHALRLSADTLKLKGTLQVRALRSVDGLSALALEAFLTAHGVQREYIDQDDLEILCKKVLNAPLQEHELVVARGVLPINGDSAVYTITDEVQEKIDLIEERTDSFKSKCGDSDNLRALDVSDEDPVDFYEQMAVVVVHKDELIAMKTERSQGVDGIDIYGNPVPACHGEASEVKLDESIEVHDDGRCVATISGLLTAEKESISISPHYAIKGDVDFQTGRIVFPGSVTVYGSVRDKFKVRTTGELSIRGLVESCELYSDDDIVLHRGMAGKEIGKINTLKNLQAGYLESVNATVKGNVIVRGEITNSTLDVRGEIRAENAAIRGGRLSVSKGGSVGSIGSIQGVSTEIEIAYLPHVQAKIVSIEKLQAQLERELRMRTGEFEAFAACLGKVTMEQIEEQMSMKFNLDQLRMRGEKLANAKLDLSKVMGLHTRSKIAVSKAIYAKTIMFMPGFKIEFNDDIIGESIIELGVTGRPSITLKGKARALDDYAKVVSNERVFRPRIGAVHPVEAA